MKVLIVDDEPSIGELYKEFVGDYGVCDISYDGSEAIELFKKAHNLHEPYDLICLDIMMPGKSGIEALSEIREIEASYSIHGFDRVKVVMVSAKDDSQSIITSFFVGRCEAYLNKPIVKHELLKVISDLGLIAAPKVAQGR